MHLAEVRQRELRKSVPAPNSLLCTLFTHNEIHGGPDQAITSILVHCPKACCDWIMTKDWYAGPHSDQVPGKRIKKKRKWKVKSREILKEREKGRE